MSAIVVIASAYKNETEWYSSIHQPPQVKDFIESMTHPGYTEHSWGNNRMYLMIDTSQQGCTVTASPSVVVPPSTRKRFSYWTVPEGPYPEFKTVYDRESTIHSRQWGWIGLYFGVPQRRLSSEYLSAQHYEQINLLVKIMKRRIPGWEPPGPWPLKGRPALRRR